MARTYEQGAPVPLGVVAIIGEAFSIFMGNFVAIMTMAVGPMLLSVVTDVALIGADVTPGGAKPQFNTAGDGLMFVLSIILQLVFYSLATALLVQLA